MLGGSTAQHFFISKEEMISIFKKLKKWWNTPTKSFEEEYLGQATDRKDFEAREKKLQFLKKYPNWY